jgi:amino acid transporter
MAKEEIRLEKKLSPINVWALALGCIIGWGAFVMPGNTFLGKAGPLGTFIAMGIAALVMIIIAINYNYMINKYPVAGGEFTYTQKTFGNRHAFVCSWFLGISYLAIVPLNGTALALIGRNLMDNIFQVGFHYTVAGYDIYLGEILLALFALGLFAFLSIRGVKFTGVFQTGLVFMLVGGVLAVVLAALISDKASFANLSPGFYPSEGSSIGGVLAVVAVAPWAFVGFDTIPQAAEEFNFSPRKTKVIMTISILFGAAVYVLLNTVTAMVVPEGYNSWVEYIDAVPELSGLIALPTFYAAKELLGTVGLVILGLAVLAAILSGIIGFYMAASRLLYSMSKENFLPPWFGKLHKDYKTPYNSILFIMVISMIAPFFGRTALNWIVDMSSLGAAIRYGYTSLAAYRTAKQKGNKKLMVTGILGGLFGLMFVILLLVPIPLFNCSLGKESYICLIIWIILGIIFYLRTRNSRNSGKKREKCIEKAMEVRGWSREKAIQEIDDCMARTGANYSQYLSFGMYNVPAENQELAFRRSKENHELSVERKKQYVRDVAATAGWTYEEAEAKMKEAKAKYGCNYKEYAYNAYYRCSEETIKKKHAASKDKWSGKREAVSNRKKEAITKTQEYLGCTWEEAENYFLEVRSRTTCQPVEYVDYELWKYDRETQDSIFFQSMGNKIRKMINTDIHWYRVFFSKRKTNRKFRKYTRRAWVDNSKVTFEEFKEAFKDAEKIFYKPDSSYGGKGAHPFELTEDNMQQVYDELKSMPRGIVEEFVKQHHKMNEMSPTAVNTVRFATMYSDIDLDAEGNHFKIAYAMLKMGGKTGCVDNLHGGGVGAAIDLETGKLCTDAVDENARHSFEYHPVTGTKIKGFEIPYFKEACEMVKEITTEFNIHGYIAWDVAIAEDGPMLIEINGDPGATLLDLPYFGTTGKGRRQYMTDLVKHFCEIY